MATWPLTLTGEILVDGEWQPVTMREDPVVTVTRGVSAEGSMPQPGTCSVTIDNRTGRYSPRNPNSDLYGKIGRGTRFRLRADDLPAQPDPVFTDDFDRTVADGWGDTAAGDTWTIYDPLGTSPPAADYDVADGTGRMTITDNGAIRMIRTDDLNLADFDGTFTVMTDQVCEGDNTRSAILGTLMSHLDADAGAWMAFVVGFRTDSGVPDGQGRRVTASIVRFADGVNSGAGTPVQAVPGLTYDPGRTMRVRVQARGPEFRVRVWADGDPEPVIWHSQYHEREPLPPGGLGLRASLSGGSGSAATTLPLSVHVGDLEITPPVADTGAIRMVGEIPAWPPRRHESGADITTPLKPSGILRRLSISTRPLRSTLRRHVPLVRPLAYWPMEEGAQGEQQIADATVGQLVGPLRVSGFHFAQDAELVGSDPLPRLRGGDENIDSMVSPPIPGRETGSWSVEMLYRLSEQDFPAGPDEKTALSFYLAGSRAQRVIVSFYTSGITGGRLMRIRVRDEDGVELATNAVDQDVALTIGGFSMLEEWRRLRVEGYQDGADLRIRFFWADLDELQWGDTVTVSGTTPGRVSQIRTFFGSEAATDNSLKGLALGHLMVWGVRFHSGFYDVGLVSAAGLRGQLVMPFLRRLHIDEDIPVEIANRSSTIFGPYPSLTFLETVKQAAVTDMGILAEKRSEPVLQYTCRDALYNQPVDLVLDYAGGEIFPPFEPTDDDKDIRNRITVKRREGSEVTRELSSGPLSVRDPQDGGIGVYEDTVETLVDADAQLAGQAGWRLHMATTDEMRLTKLTLRMGNPRMRALIDTVLALDVGARIRIVNLPADMPPDGFDLRVMGYREEFATGRWDWTANCVPYSPWTVGATAPDGGDEATPVERQPGRVDTDMSVLAAPAAAAATQLVVHTPGQPWILAAPPLNANGDFEDGLAGWTAFGATQEVVPTPGVHPAGAIWALEMVPGGVEPFPNVGSDVVPVTAGEEYTLVGWLRCAVAREVGLSMNWFIAGAYEATAANDLTIPADTWIWFEQTAVAPVGVDGANAAPTVSGGVPGEVLHATGVHLRPTRPVQHAQDFPFAAQVDGETVQVDGIEPLVEDAFARTVAEGWGTATSGQVWVLAGGADADRSVDGDAGVVTLTTAPATIRLQQADPTAVADAEVRVRMSVDQVATGASLIPGILLRTFSATAFYRARLHFGTGGAMYTSITRGTTQIGGSPQLPYTYTAGSWWNVRARVDGHRVRIKVWPDTVGEPQLWASDETVPDELAIEIGTLGLAASAFTGNTNTAPALVFDDFVTRSVQAWTVTRARNGVTKGQARGADVRLAVPTIISL